MDAADRTVANRQQGWSRCADDRQDGTDGGVPAALLCQGPIG